MRSSFLVPARVPSSRLEIGRDHQCVVRVLHACFVALACGDAASSALGGCICVVEVVVGVLYCSTCGGGWKGWQHWRCLSTLFVWCSRVVCALCRATRLCRVAEDMVILQG